ncbi:isoprenylcysteine carboxylmethyltransferase family protein [Geminicoccaceae bacterium 1502E]|nr:isoprenylcysteine carboxylmethyltransferase family protein [Geminicoccaceae bacterium 1502E]
MSVGPVHLVVLLVALQRLWELRIAARNTSRLRALGAIEHGARHYPLFILLHGGWLLALALLVPAGRAPDWWLLGLWAALQPLRLWIVASLGGRWTTRILVLPDAPLVRRGPYRWLRHPNYLLVLAEIPLLPLAFGAWELALAFGLANLLLLAWRRRVEERALRGQLPSADGKEPGGPSRRAAG